MAGVDTVLSDRTGTLTTGRPRVTSIQPLNGLGELDLLPLAATAEKFSEHPIADAIVDAADLAVEVGDPDLFEALPGIGGTCPPAARFPATSPVAARAARAPPARPPSRG
jgi:cation transport ATPase